MQAWAVLAPCLAMQGAPKQIPFPRLTFQATHIHSKVYSHHLYRTKVIPIRNKAILQQVGKAQPTHTAILNSPQPKPLRREAVQELVLLVVPPHQPTVTAIRMIFRSLVRLQVLAPIIITPSPSLVPTLELRVPALLSAEPSPRW